ncbi:MAG: CDP-alcohol phosphatidyltransferase family protein [Actinomycetota bacterium]|nr:CDP-alcohol phosphatidyltransferase family protein [Actinomycetota bacterium]
MRPSLTELRAVAQPPSLTGRTSAEHWAGKLYMRRLSLHATRFLVGTPVSANTLTGLMILVGLAAAAVATVPTLWAALLTVIGIQAYLLLDCSDGEVARWRGTTGPVGVYLDRLGHYVVEAALIAAIGLRADAGHPAGWTLLGLLGSVFVLLNKAETDLVGMARASAGLPLVTDAAAVPRAAGVRRARSVASRLRFHRAIGAVELSLLLGVAAASDALAGSLQATRLLVAIVVPLAGVVAVGHLLSVLSSNRLR